MNNYVPIEIKEKYPAYNFTGKPFKLKNGKTYIRAFHSVLEQTHYYSFDEDFFWWDKEDILTT